jgi:hypothetical protein
MPSAARQRWLGEGMNMDKVVERTQQRNGEPSLGTDAMSVWSEEFQINARESLRAELRRHKTRVTLDLRRWFKPPEGAARPTGRGFAISLRHVLAIQALLGAAIAQAVAGGFLNESGETR